MMLARKQSSRVSMESIYRYKTSMKHISRAVTLAKVLPVYGFAIFFDDAMQWNHLRRLAADDLKIVDCARTNGHAKIWSHVTKPLLDDDAVAKIAESYFLTKS
jgi:hypothetical protein